ncbi:HAMP domain-containing protein [Roseibium denhamense]|uniref:histidine kinase n=1 Tax=Roseibium denhamense TaxID=76305 RepID=A0ABY1N6C0_9HYPH|nr:ATP-binding protein [Roseibium denhamense]MTI06056.1 HAMP domain-containing protein [Roseibium denhamense]SMP01631.1 Signal transduction histidine kinase [Roseibium denhamense]
MTFLKRVTRFAAILWPQKLATQLVLLLLAAIIAAQAISILIFQDQRRIAMVALARDNILSRAVSLAELVRDTPPDLQTRILDASSSQFAVFWLGDTPIAPEPGQSRFERRLQDFLEEQLASGQLVHLNIHADEKRGPSRTKDKDRESWRSVPKDERPKQLRRIMNRPEDLSLSIKLADDQWLNLATSYRPPPAAFLPLLVQLALTALAIIVIIAFAVRRVTRPLNDLSEAAERLGRGEDIDTLPQTGPQEVRAVTNAFNNMQERLTRFVRDRTRMLAAISHDLRTPITSLRLRAEFIDDDENREKMIETLDDMAAMTEATLKFAKEDAFSEPAEEVNIAAMLDAIAQDQRDLGFSCDLQDKEPLLLVCRPVSLKRAFRNLIENGNRYGGPVEVKVSREADHILVRISDQGPGVPEDRLQDIFEPFVRLDESRNEDTGGIGLGLAITRSIVHAHGGTITLENLPERGLRVTVSLPGIA